MNLGQVNKLHFFSLLPFAQQAIGFAQISCHGTKAGIRLIQLFESTISKQKKLDGQHIDNLKKDIISITEGFLRFLPIIGTVYSMIKIWKESHPQKEPIARGSEINSEDFQQNEVPDEELKPDPTGEILRPSPPKNLIREETLDKLKTLTEEHPTITFKDTGDIINIYLTIGHDNDTIAQELINVKDDELMCNVKIDVFMNNKLCAKIGAHSEVGSNLKDLETKEKYPVKVDMVDLISYMNLASSLQNYAIEVAPRPIPKPPEASMNEKELLRHEMIKLKTEFPNVKMTRKGQVYTVYTKDNSVFTKALELHEKYSHIQTKSTLFGFQVFSDAVETPREKEVPLEELILGNILKIKKDFPDVEVKKEGDIFRFFAPSIETLKEMKIALADVFDEETKEKMAQKYTSEIFLNKTKVLIIGKNAKPGPIERSIKEIPPHTQICNFGIASQLQ